MTDKTYVKKSSLFVAILAPENWEDFKYIRLKALEQNSEMFCTEVEKEKNLGQEDWKNRLADDEKIIFGLYFNREIIGIAGISLLGVNATLWGVWVDPKYRRQNLSSYLIKFSIDWLCTNNNKAKVVKASCREDNLAIRKVFVKLGFVQVNHNIRTWNDNRSLEEIHYEYR